MSTLDDLNAANHAPMVDRGTRTGFVAMALLCAACVFIMAACVLAIGVTLGLMEDRLAVPAALVGAWGAFTGFVGLRVLRLSRERARKG